MTMPEPSTYISVPLVTLKPGETDKALTLKTRGVAARSKESQAATWTLLSLGT